MTFLTALANSDEANVFQKYLIPPESRAVRTLMQYAAACSEEKSFFFVRVVSVASATAAVGCSFFNAVSYLLQVPFKFLLNLARFDPISAVFDCIVDVTNVLRSLVFISLAITLVVAGAIFPRQIFRHFSPTGTGSRLEVLEEDNQTLIQKARTAQSERDNALKKVEGLKKELATLRERVAHLRGERPGWKFW